jgi:redox-sensitive bicupin YhaK (pirin superfamily)
MSAGSGVTHSEFNPSKTDPVHFLQIWILPERNGMPPSYEEKHFSRESKLNALRLIGSRDGRDGSMVIHQDVDLYASILEPGHSVGMKVSEDRYLWVQVVSGRITVNGTELATGDAAAMERTDTLTIGALDEAELLVFDVG